MLDFFSFLNLLFLADVKLVGLYKKKKKKWNWFSAIQNNLVNNKYFNIILSNFAKNNHQPWQLFGNLSNVPMS